MTRINIFNTEKVYKFKKMNAQQKKWQRYKKKQSTKE